MRRCQPSETARQHNAPPSFCYRRYSVVVYCYSLHNCYVRTWRLKLAEVWFCLSFGVGVKLFSHWRRNTGWGGLRKGCREWCLGLRGEWRRLHNRGIRDSWLLSNIIGVMKWNRMKRAKRVARTAVKRSGGRLTDFLVPKSRTHEVVISLSRQPTPWSTAQTGRKFFFLLTYYKILTFVRPAKSRCSFVSNLNISVLICHKTGKNISRHQREGVWACNPDPQPIAVLRYTDRTAYEVTYRTGMSRMQCTRKRLVISS
jgi:hypothetical protein